MLRPSLLLTLLTALFTADVSTSSTDKPTRTRSTTAVASTVSDEDRQIASEARIRVGAALRDL